jgi:hypothetical protein
MALLQRHEVASFVVRLAVEPASLRAGHETRYQDLRSFIVQSLTALPIELDLNRAAPIHDV